MNTEPFAPPRRLIAHRGAAAERPENSMAAFERAVALGVDVLETDVQFSRDGDVIVSHDETAERNTGVAKAFVDCSLSEIKRWDAGYGFVDAAGEHVFRDRKLSIPTLHEVLETFTDVRVNIDIKPRRPAMAQVVLDVIRRHDAESRVGLGSFHESVMRAVRRGGFRGEMALTQQEVVGLLVLPMPLLRRLPYRGRAAQIPRNASVIRLDSERFIRRCHALGVRVDYWTVDDPSDAATLLARGADGVISNDPRAMLELFERTPASQSAIDG